MQQRGRVPTDGGRCFAAGSPAEAAEQELYARVRALAAAERSAPLGPPDTAGNAPAGGVDSPPAAGAEPVDDQGLDADLRDWYDLDCDRPRVAVLGPVTVDAPGQPPADRYGFYAEVVTYLAIRGRRGATPLQLETAMWPDRPISPSSRQVVMARVRRWLGRDRNGRWWLPSALVTGRYRLANGYLLDWDLFCRLRHRSDQHGADGADDLRRALKLVRGSPYNDGPQQTTRHPYRWLPAHSRPQRLVSAVADTAAQLAHRCSQVGDTGTAQWALTQARLADPDQPDTASRADLGDAPQTAAYGQRTNRSGTRA